MQCYYKAPTLSESFPKTIGRYELIDRLAVGGMAELFLARSMSAGAPATPVVIKRLLPHMAGDPNFNAMFLDEAKLTNRLAHPNIAGTYELGRHEDQLYMVMEYVDGIDCLAVLRECARAEVRLPEAAAVYIAHEILEALDFAHNEVDDNGAPLNVVHRDISPSNVLLSRRGEVKLVDFGIARAARQEHQTKDGTLKGKYGYMSPEQVLEESVDARADLFSVGIVLAELLTGRRLFAARNDLDVLIMVRDVNLSRLERHGAHIDPALQRILRTALQKQPSQRFSSAAAFRAELARWLAREAAGVGASDIAGIVESLYARVQRGQSERESSNGIRVARDAGDDMAHLELVSRTSSRAAESRDSMPIISIITDTIDLPDDNGDSHVTDVYQSASNDLAQAGAGADEDAGDDALPVELDDLLSGPMSNSSLLELLNRKVGWDALDFDDSIVSAVETRPLGAPLRDRGGAGPANARAEPALPARPDDQPDDTGDFASSPPISVLYRLATTRATGLLQARVGGIRKEVYFRAGIPEYVSSNVHAERFGEYLVSHGVLGAQQLSYAVTLMPHYRGKLGDTLVALDLLEPLEVFRWLTRQVRHKLIDLCTWSGGTFSWYGGREHPPDSFPLDLNAFEIMGASAMQLPDSVVQRWLERMPSGCRPRVKAHPRLGIEVFQLGSFLSQMHDDMHSDATVEELLAFYGSERGVFLRALYLLVHTEFVALGE